MRFEPRKAIVITYAVRGFRSAQTATVTVYDSKGSVALAASNMTELGSTGVYKKTWIPGKSDTYISKCDCAAYPSPSYNTIVVGGKPGDLARGGFILKKSLDVWTEKEKKLLLEIVAKLAEKFEVLKSAQAEVEKRLSNLSSLSAELNSGLKGSFDSYLQGLEVKKDIHFHLQKEGELFKKEIDSKFGLLNQKIDSFGPEISKKTSELQVQVNKEVAELQSKTSETLSLSSKNLQLASEKFRNKISSLNKDEIVRKLEDFSLLADEVNVSLSQLNSDPSRIKLNNAVEILLSSIDELSLNLKNHEGGAEVVSSLNGSSPRQRSF